MLSLVFTLFLAGMLTILLPCILPLVPIVLGVSIAGQNRLRPLVTVAGMVVGFVVVTFVLQVILMQFAEAATLVQISTYDALILFGAGFLTERRVIRYVLAVIGAAFFVSEGWLVASVALVVNVLLLEVGGVIAARLQQLGADVQGTVRGAKGADSLLTAFIVGLTLGLVWVPCAGPALGFALALVREQPGPLAFLYLTAYAIGAGLPLLIIGYGGQAAVRSVRVLTKYSGVVKHIAGGLLILTAIALQFNLLADFQVWLAGTPVASIATKLEDQLFPEKTGESGRVVTRADGSLPDLGVAPDLAKLGPWHNSQPLSAEDLKGKVVLIDFWTYSCINCIRTLPYIQGYWDRFKSGPFVVIGVHTPEFAFEQDPENVAAAVERHGLTYPVAQDNMYGTWRAFSNHYWPAKYLIDAKGHIRYTHFGEGDYEETGDAIASLLLEAGYSFDQAAPQSSSAAPQALPVSPETYLGTRGFSSLVNGGLMATDQPVEYVMPKDLELNKVALGGQWQMKEDERQVLLSATGSIRIHALGGEVNLVIGTEDDDAMGGEATVWVDGKQVAILPIDRRDLYPLFKGQYGEHDVRVTFSKPGVSVYAYTFGQ